MCSHGWHLLDEVQSLEHHSLFCDACEMDIPIAAPKTKPKCNCGAHRVFGVPHLKDCPQYSSKDRLWAEEIKADVSPLTSIVLRVK